MPTEERVRNLILEAIEEAGTTDPGKVSLAIEDIRTRKAKNKTAWCVFKGLEVMGMSKYSDVVKLVDKYKEDA